ncbi:hypothetical protein Sjap_024431 [Stephania japonica]|uniref:Response regulatory domain-containing protein n=1 Tax=Stephania japonica TaxID=461633 RepID=A0AAP0EM15_9MAGN
MMSKAGSSSGSCKMDGVGSAQFPIGLRVLVVDDDTVCLRVLDHMLRKCLYHECTKCPHGCTINYGLNAEIICYEPREKNNEANKPYEKQSCLHKLK